MICERCRCVFCWDGADEIIIGGPRKRYCSDTCAKKAHKVRTHRTKVQLRMCRERPKPGYATQEAALLAVAELRRIPPLYPYECPCGWWHLTSESQELEVNAEFDAFRGEFLDHILEASGVPEDEKQLWRDLR